jgi:putative selenium metabolism hydrolase
MNNRLFGRGAVDTKGNLAAMIYAAAKVDRSKINGSIIVSATVSEEVMEGGSIRTVIEETNPDFVVIGEATQLNINRGGRGRAEIVIETTGKSAHSSSPEVGICAVHEMMKFVSAIDKRPLTTHPLLGPDSMVLTDIISYPYPGSSVIPNRCRVTYDRRLLTGESPETVMLQLRNLADETGVGCKISIVESTEETYIGQKMDGKKFFPAWSFPEDHPFIQNAITALRKIKPETQIGAYRFCTNAAYTAGIAGIPTIGYGLGKESEAHTVDESLSLEELILASHGYRDIIEAVLNSFPA